jgi:pimeloyl-ACP methyl ester carboxylesterase
MKFILLLLLSLPAFGMTFPEYLETKKKNVSHQRHLPYLLSHGHKTEKSVLLIHGIFSSPLYFKGMAKAFFERGYNVVTILLPGHWEKDLYRMGKLDSKEWSREADIGWEIAKQHGDKVILAGHSLGSLLNLEQSMKRDPEEIHGMVMLSPAVRLNWPTVISARAGEQFNINGNHFVFQKPDGIQVPDFHPKAALLIRETQIRVLNKPVSIPYYLAYTWADPVLDVPGLIRYFNQYPIYRKISYFGPFSGVFHNNISQSPDDFLTQTTAKGNPHFVRMMNEALDFIDSL